MIGVGVVVGGGGGGGWLVVGWLVVGWWPLLPRLVF